MSKLINRLNNLKSHVVRRSAPRGIVVGEKIMMRCSSCPRPGNQTSTLLFFWRFHGRVGWVDLVQQWTKDTKRTKK